MLTVPALEKSWNFNIFQSSSNYIKLAEHIAIIIRNMHVSCEIWAFSEKLNFFTEKCRAWRPFIISWNFNIFSKFTKFHQTCSAEHIAIIIRNMHVKFEPIQRSFSQKNADSAGPRNIMKFQVWWNWVNF